MDTVWRRLSDAVGEKEEGRNREQSFATRKDMTCEEPSWGRHHLRTS
jgi:hypothetical protein